MRTLGTTGRPVLLLHGLVASSVFWGGAYDRLASPGRLVVPDLLGFGASDRPSGGYGPDEHASAVVECLDELGVREPATVGAHSLGCLVALRLAALHPDRVASVVGFGPPLYRDRATATAHITSSGPMARLFALPGPVAELACDWVCGHRRLAARLAVLTHPGLPAPVAADAVQHSWASYSETVNRVILGARPEEWLEDVRAPVRLVAGDRDPVVDPGFIVHLARDRPGLSSSTWVGDHHLPLVQPERCAATIGEETNRAPA